MFQFNSLLVLSLRAQVFCSLPNNDLRLKKHSSTVLYLPDKTVSHNYVQRIFREIIAREIIALTYTAYSYMDEKGLRNGFITKSKKTQVGRS